MRSRRTGSAPKPKPSDASHCSSDARARPRSNRAEQRCQVNLAGRDQIPRGNLQVATASCQTHLASPRHWRRGLAADQMGLGIEGVVDRRMGHQETLGGSLGLEPLHLSFSPPDRQMGVFGSVLPRSRPGRWRSINSNAFSVAAWEPRPSVVIDSGSTGWLRNRRLSNFRAAFVLRRRCITRARTSPSSSTAPQMHAPSADIADHLVQMPTRRRRRSPALQVPGDLRAELDRPAADFLIAHLDPRWFLDVAETQGEAEVEPHRVADDLGRDR